MEQGVRRGGCQGVGRDVGRGKHPRDGQGESRGKRWRGYRGGRRGTCRGECMSGFPVGELVAAASCLLLGSFIAGAEAAVVSLPEARLRALRDEMGERRGAPLTRYLSEPTRVLTSLLAFRVTALIVAAVLTTNALVQRQARWWELAAIVAVLSLVYSVLAEVFVTVARARARSLAPLALMFTRPFELLVSPLVAPLLPLSRMIHARAAQRNTSDPPEVTEREVEYLVEQAEHTGALDPSRGEMLQNVLELKDLTARDVMVPRTRIHALEASTPLDRALAIVTEEGHSRVPVYKGQIDNVIGILHVKDLFRVAHGPEGGRNVPVETLVRKPVLFVADSQSALTLLRDMQARRMHMAMVIDEFGAVAGLVTLEDILEELVGDIQDEHDVEEAQLVEQSPGRFLVAAAIPLSKLGEQLGVEFPEHDTYATLGGFLAEQTGKVPAVGTTVRWNGWTFTVREGNARTVTKVEIVADAQTTQPATDATAPR